MSSLNFDHLKNLSEELYRLGVLAERFFGEDANTSLIKSRQFAEYMLKEIAALSGAYDPNKRENASDLIRRLTARQLLPREVADVFHAVRKHGNAAAHDFASSPGDALSALKLCRSLGIWYRRTFGRDPNFRPGPFVPPKNTQGQDAETSKLLEQYRSEALEREAELQELKATAEDLAKAKQAAEELASQANATAEEWASTAFELEANQAKLEERLRSLQSLAKAAPEQTILEFKQAGLAAAADLELDERDTRNIIDAQLVDMGWEADTSRIRHALGARPEEGRNLAIAEWPTETGPVDYALFIGLTCVGVVEAKRECTDVPGVLRQAERYAAGIKLEPENLALDAPWHQGLKASFRVPFAFATNGRPFIRQWKIKSGIWHRDLRRDTNQAQVLPQWFSPRDLTDKLRTNASAAAQGLAEEPVADRNLRPYQREAVQAVENAIESGQQAMLVSMATGTGKTLTSIALMYRLLKHERFRRILFLVDRNALGEQTQDAMETAEVEGLYKFSEVYRFADLKQQMPDVDQQVQVATVQSLVARIVREPDLSRRPSPGTYDCIIVDEAHRGYTLDAELRESEIAFRNLDEYQSAYRQVLDYFDAVKIALTATPALHTVQIFGHPVFHYGYRQAVIEGYLIDHLPPRRIITALNEAGIHFKGGEEVEVIDRRTGQLELFSLPDDLTLDYEVGDFNKRVYSEEFNRAVCRAITTEIPPDAPGKTLIYAAREEHAEDIARLLIEELKDEYGEAAIPANMVIKITGKTDRNQDWILKFKNDPQPKYVITVDLLTTGVDVPSICNLVFVRRVKSRILYDQMIGRATRLCPDIGKKNFRIFDAVDLYAELQEISDMKPVVVNPKVTLSQLAVDLVRTPEGEDKDWVAGQVVVKMRGLVPNMDEETRQSFELHTGETPEATLRTLAGLSGRELQGWIQSHQRAIPLLERQAGRQRPDDGVVISTHEDELLRIEEIFGRNTTPEDYIEGFERFVRQNMNTIPALIAVTQKPADLTRKELAALAALLDEENYSEPMLRAAYGKARNADIAAHIIGFVRQAALGDPLIPYETRVDRAVAKIEASRPWTSRQKRWLERIARALKDKPVADPTLLEQGAFADKGGFAVIAREFDDHLDDVLRQFNEQIWGSPPAA